MKKTADPAKTAVAVIGGGPAGLTAAAEAAAAGAATVLLEGEERPGKKLILTGRGRCNLTNTLPLDEFLDAYGPNGRFLRNAYSRFFRDDLVAFLKEIGVETSLERGGRIYPSQGSAGTVLEALQRHGAAAGVQTLTNRLVTDIAQNEGGGFTVGGKDFSLTADRVVIAAGGASFPWTGSRGDGCRFARKLGHRVTPLRPALVPVRCSESFLPRLTGLKLRNVELSFRPRPRQRRTFFGEVHFTDFGISGPAVFPASAEIGRLAEKKPLALELNFKPALQAAILEGRLTREFTGGGRTLADAMASLLPRMLVPVFLEEAGTDPGHSTAEVTREMRRRILTLLQAFPLTATGTLPLERAMVTAGGVRLGEIDPKTMESRIVPGLYFCGEVLDLDGSTGGFNLQAAFSTGILAGRHAGGGEKGGPP